MTLSAVGDFLRRTVGLDAASLGSGVVERSVRKRMHEISAPTFEEYHSRLLQSSAELQKLVDEIVVPETYFFRDPGVFTALTEWVRGEWLPASPAGVLQVLSIPCSTGEEPYSIAMTLLDAGVPAERFIVDAVDLSERALQLARRGVYGTNAFRGESRGARERHFVQTPEGAQVGETVRERVRFRQGNLLDFARPPRPYDVVFCRNVLIYFDPATQKLAMEGLTELVSLDGLLFVGSAEAVLASSHPFRPLGRPMSFGFRRTDAVSERTPAGKKPVRRPTRVTPATVTAPTQRAAPATGSAWSAAKHSGQSAESKPLPADDALARAEALADSGRLAEATALCKAYIAANGASASAYFLLGMAADSAGDSQEAVSYFRKAVYLEPRHEQALIHLALLTHQRGGTAQAERLHSRAQSLSGNATALRDDE